MSGYQRRFAHNGSGKEALKGTATLAPQKPWFQTTAPTREPLILSGYFLSDELPSARRTQIRNREYTISAAVTFRCSGYWFVNTRRFTTCTSPR